MLYEHRETPQLISPTVFPVLPPKRTIPGYARLFDAKSTKTSGMVCAEVDGRRYQLVGMRSWPRLIVKLPGSPETAKNDFSVSRSKYPPGFSAEWFDMKLITKLCAAGATSPEKGPEK